MWQVVCFLVLFCTLVVFIPRSNGYMIQVDDNLFLCNDGAVENDVFLLKNNISAVISLEDHKPRPETRQMFRDNKISFYFFPEGSKEIDLHDLENVGFAIRNQVSLNRNVAIYDNRRAPVAVAFYLWKEDRLPCQYFLNCYNWLTRIVPAMKGKRDNTYAYDVHFKISFQNIRAHFEQKRLQN